MISPFLCTTFTSGYMSRISFGTGPFGPVSADVVITTGRSNSLPMAACPRMLEKKSVVSQSRAMERRPTWWSTMRRACVYDREIK